jgi:putative membrane protein
MRFHVKGERLLKSIILVFVTAFLIRLVVTHEIYMLVSPVIATIVKVATFVFAVISIIHLVSCVTIRKAARIHTSGHADVHVHDHEHASLNSTWGRVTVALFATFLGVAFSWHPKALGTDMLAQNNNASDKANAQATDTNTVSNSTPTVAEMEKQLASMLYASQGAVQQKSGEISEATIAIDYESDKQRFLGHSTTLQGFVYHPRGLPSNYFILTRYFIFCCIADATPLGVVVESPAASQLKNDQWVSVSGVLQTRQLPRSIAQYQPTSWYPDRDQPVLVAGHIQRIPEPQYPYMVPNY